MEEFQNAVKKQLRKAKKFGKKDVMSGVGSSAKEKRKQRKHHNKEMKKFTSNLNITKQLAKNRNVLSAFNFS